MAPLFSMDGGPSLQGYISLISCYLASPALLNFRGLLFNIVVELSSVFCFPIE